MKNSSDNESRRAQYVRAKGTPGVVICSYCKGVADPDKPLPGLCPRCYAEMMNVMSEAERLEGQRLVQKTAEVTA